MNDIIMIEWMSETIPFNSLRFTRCGSPQPKFNCFPSIPDANGGMHLNLIAAWLHSENKSIHRGR